MTTTVSLSFAALTIDSADPAALADFWGKALGRPVSPGGSPPATWWCSSSRWRSRPRATCFPAAGNGTAR